LIKHVSYPLFSPSLALPSLIVSPAKTPPSAAIEALTIIARRKPTV
jgi:hypothetical protein